MAAIPDGPLNRQQARQIAAALRDRLARQVAMEVWTRTEPAADAAELADTVERDRGVHAAETLALMLQLKSLHPALTLTPYDLDRHAAMAEERGIQHSPTVVMRCGGRAIRTVGMFYGPFFEPFLDELGFLSLGETPLAPETQALLRGIEDEVTIEAFLTPFDPLSVRLIALLGAFAVEGKRFRVTQIEASQFPVLAGQRLVTEVPLLVINGRRFEGLFTEDELARQVLQVVEGADGPPIRQRVYAAEYLSEWEARRMAAEQLRARTGGQPPQSPGSDSPGSGLIVPGRMPPPGARPPGEPPPGRPPPGMPPRGPRPPQ